MLLTADMSCNNRGNIFPLAIMNRNDKELLVLITSEHKLACLMASCFVLMLH